MHSLDQELHLALSAPFIDVHTKGNAGRWRQRVGMAEPDSVHGFALMAQLQFQVLFTDQAL